MSKKSESEATKLSEHPLDALVSDLKFQCERCGAFGEHFHYCKGINVPLKPNKYTPPKITKRDKMNFPVEIIDSQGRRMVCRQCSSCHGCR